LVKLDDELTKSRDVEDYVLVLNGRQEVNYPKEDLGNTIATEALITF